MFANREPQLLRQKLRQIEEDNSLKKNSIESIETQKVSSDIILVRILLKLSYF